MNEPQSGGQVWGEKDTRGGLGGGSGSRGDWEVTGSQGHFSASCTTVQIHLLRCLEIEKHHNMGRTHRSTVQSGTQVFKGVHS